MIRGGITSQAPSAWWKGVSDAILKNRITKSFVWPIIRPRVQKEIDVGVTPTDYSYKELHSPRYGDVADGSTNVTTALTNGDAVGSLHIECGAAYGTHLIGSNLTFTNRPKIYPGEILKPDTGVSITFSKFPDIHPSHQAFDLSVVNDGTKIVWPTYDRWEVPAAWFGAIPNADATKHDQEKYIQYTLDSLGARGGVVKLAGGDYYCSNMLTVGTNRIIRGDNYLSTGLRVSGTGWGANTSFVQFINGTSSAFGSRLENLNIDGNSNTTVTKLIDAQDWNELCGLYFCYVRGFTKYGLYLSNYYSGSANAHLHAVQMFESSSASGVNRACIYMADPGFSQGWFQLHCKELVVVGNATDGQTNCTGIVAQGRVKVLAGGIHGEKLNSIISMSGAASVYGDSIQATGNATVTQVFSYGSTATGKIDVAGADIGGATYLVKDNRATATNLVYGRAQPYSAPVIYPPDPARAIAGGKFVGTATPSISYAQGLSAIAHQATGQFRITLSPGLNDSTAYDVAVENYHSATLVHRVVNSTSTFDVFFTDLSNVATDPDAFAVKVYHRAGGANT